MRASLLVFLAWLGSGLAGCACSELDGSTFASLSEGECGLGPGGVSLCTWHISFDSGDFTWQHSDYGVSGSYDCDGGTIVGHGYQQTYEGEYDASNDLLTWEGVEYARQ